MEDYAHCPPARLADSIGRLTERLGGERKKTALRQLEVKDFRSVAETLLSYYDKAYTDALARRDADLIHRTVLPSRSHADNAHALLMMRDSVVAARQVEQNLAQSILPLHGS